MARALCLILSGAAMAVGALAAAGPAGRQGQEMLAFDPETVTELSATAPGLRLVAHRSGPRRPFDIAVFTPGGVVTCRGGAGLMQVLQSLHSLRLGKAFSHSETTKLQESARTIRLRFVVADDIDLGEWSFYLPAGSNQVAVQSERMDEAAEAAVGKAAFASLEAGCRKLGESP